MFLVLAQIGSQWRAVGDLHYSKEEAGERAVDLTFELNTSTMVVQVLIHNEIVECEGENTPISSKELAS